VWDEALGKQLMEKTSFFPESELFFVFVLVTRMVLKKKDNFLPLGVDE